MLSASPLFNLAGHSGRVLSVAWGCAGQLYSGSDDQTLRLWHVENAEVCVLLHSPKQPCALLNRVRGGRLMAACRQGRALQNLASASGLLSRLRYAPAPHVPEALTFGVRSAKA